MEEVNDTENNKDTEESLNVITLSLLWVVCIVRKRVDAVITMEMDLRKIICLSFDFMRKERNKNLKRREWEILTIKYS